MILQNTLRDAMKQQQSTSKNIPDFLLVDSSSSILNQNKIPKPTQEHYV